MRPGNFHPENSKILSLILLLLLASCASVKWGFYRTSLATDDPDFLDLLSEVADEPLVGGNRAEILLNGREIFPAMLADIRSAKQTVNLETYIFDDDGVGREFAAALMERARAGVRVNVIVDEFGDGLGNPLKKLMADSGIQLRVFNPWTWWHPQRSNRRTHRKLLIVDGRVGYTGGAGLDDRWAGDADAPGHWRETQVRLEGSVVQQFQTMFLESWKNTAGEILRDPDLFPPLRPVGDVLAAAVGRWKPKTWSNVREMFLLPLAASQRYFYVNSAYFSPDFDCMNALRDAVERGVDVRLIVAGDKTDIWQSHSLARKNYGRFLKAGVKIYEYTGTNMHAKTIVSDALFVMIGSANFDNRSFNYNYESNLVVYDEKVAARMEQIFLDDLKHSKEVNVYEWEKRSTVKRILEQAIGVAEGFM